METETETKKVAKPQIVVNVSEEQKATIQQLKADYKLTDKGVITLLLSVALANQTGLMPDDDGNPVEIDTFDAVVAGLGLAKKTKVEKPILTDEEKQALKDERKKEKIRKKLAELTGQLEESEPETLVVVGE